jgi:hypothetical protein
MVKNHYIGSCDRIEIGKKYCNHAKQRFDTAAKGKITDLTAQITR